MSVLVGPDTRLVVQGITGSEGTFHTLRNRAYGTAVVAGVTPGKGGQDVEGIPVFDTVTAAVAATAPPATPSDPLGAICFRLKIRTKQAAAQPSARR
jgi:succinyl-CoA synthetase alpha subunit